MDIDAHADHLVLVHVRASAPVHGSFPRFGFAGEVEAVEKRVTEFRVGEAVYGIADSAFGAFVCVPHYEIARVPPSLAFDAAAALARPMRVTLNAPLLPEPGVGSSTTMLPSWSVIRRARSCRNSWRDG